MTDLNHGTQGYVEWCMILSHEGKPNPYDNFNSAPVLINPHTGEVTYTPLYYILSHFSKFMRPGAVRIDISGDDVDGVICTSVKNPYGSICLVTFNSNRDAVHFIYTLEGHDYHVTLNGRTLQTLYFKPQTTHQ